MQPAHAFEPLQMACKRALQGFQLGACDGGRMRKTGALHVGNELALLADAFLYFSDRRSAASSSLSIGSSIAASETQRRSPLLDALITFTD